MLKNFPIVINTSVAWGEMDALNHVNNTIYFKYFENARIAYFTSLDLMPTMQSQKLAPVLGSTQCRYKVPLTYPDDIAIGARITDISCDRFTMEYQVFSEKHQRVAAVGEAVVVAFNVASGQKDTIPTPLVDAIKRAEADAGNQL
ncbi:acyl-CoA thioesterase [Corallincola platygyrae]|uniref:Acyl-CoA thioesterase n=1 Tax=Corallincola platygyrae TaxID=1193278 RepID=A0ABW4XMM7_9GAMM